MLPIIVFSKDRPFQLELMIKSLYQIGRLSESIYVIYTTIELYESKYDSLISAYPEINFIKEKYSFKSTLLFVFNNLRKSKFTHILFFVDDNVITSKLTIPSQINKFSIFSNRLGSNIKGFESQLKNISKFIDVNNIERYSLFVWMLRKNLDWSYCPSLDGDCIPRWLIYLSLLLKTKGPNSFERNLNYIARFFKLKYIFNSKSSVVGVPHNLVQTEWSNNSFQGNLNILNESRIKSKIIIPSYMINCNKVHVFSDYSEFIDLSDDDL